MTLTRSRIIAGASGFCGEPADESLPGGVPEWLRYELAADIELELLRDLNLSAENRSIAKFPVRLKPGTREFTISQTGFENPSYVTVTREGVSDVIPTDVTIGNLSLLNSEARDGRMTVAFYADKPQQGIVSWMPSGDETLTVWYDRSPNTDPSADQTTFTITDSYVPLLKLLLAAQMLELMQKKLDDYPMLKGRITRGLDQWKRFVRSGRQQGIVEKTAWRPGRYSGGASQWDGWPGRVRFD